MPGVRIHHKTLRNCVRTVEHPFRRYSTPYQCPLCGIEHVMKTYHITLDNEGYAIVSTTVLERLKQADADFEVSNEVLRPPRLLIGLDEQGVTLPIEARRLGDG